MPELLVKATRFEAHRAIIYAIRRTVFVVEQSVPLEIEIDEHDPVARHVVAFIGDEPVGTGRITADARAGRIGRMAVLAAHRGRGVGRELLQTLIGIGRDQGLERFVLSAQCQAVPFYERMGFVADGPIYIEAGIDHRWMELSPDAAVANASGNRHK
jgi:predicted GNAT family N-acyltransferase